VILLQILSILLFKQIGILSICKALSQRELNKHSWEILIFSVFFIASIKTLYSLEFQHASIELKKDPYSTKMYHKKALAFASAFGTPSGARTLDTLIKSYGQTASKKFLPIVAFFRP